MDKFRQVLEDLYKLYASKNADYSSELDPFYNLRKSVSKGVPAWIGALIRADDKTGRIETFIQRGKLNNESVEDSLIDRCVYDIMALILYREEQCSTDQAAPTLSSTASSAVPVKDSFVATSLYENHLTSQLAVLRQTLDTLVLQAQDIKLLLPTSLFQDSSFPTPKST